MAFDEQTFREKLDHRVALRLFDAAFVACNRLPDDKRHEVFEEIARRMLRTMPFPARADEAAESVPAHSDA